MQTSAHQTTQPPTRRALVLHLLLMAMAAGPAAAQNMNINAEVPVRSPTGAGTRNLTFGEVVPLVDADRIVNVVAATAGGAVQSGEFRYDVGGVRGVVFNVAVPTELTVAGAPGLAMTANGTEYGAYCTTAGPTCTLTNFDPTAGDVTVCRATPSGMCIPRQAFTAGTTMRVYVGGQLSVPATARAGVYRGTVTLTIVQVY